MRKLLLAAGPRRIVYQASALTGLRRGEMAKTKADDSPAMLAYLLHESPSRGHHAREAMELMRHSTGG